MDPTPKRIARQIKVPEPLHAAVEKRATAEGQDVIEIVIDYITRYANGAGKPRPAIVFAAGEIVIVPESPVAAYPSRSIPTRRLSFRIDAETWETALARAVEEGTVLAAIVTRFLRGYAAHIIN